MPFDCRSVAILSANASELHTCSAGTPSVRQRENRWWGIGGNMATVDITDVRPNRNGFAEVGLNPPAELWAPPLAPDGTTATGHVLLREDTIHAAMGDEDPSFFQPPEPSNLSETFGSRRKLIAGAAIIAALAVAGVTYFFLASPGAKAPAETAVQSSSETPAQAALNVPEPSSPTRAQSSSGLRLLCLSHLAERPVRFLRPMFPPPSRPRLRPKLLQMP